MSRKSDKWHNYRGADKILGSTFHGPQTRWKTIKMKHMLYNGHFFDSIPLSVAYPLSDRLMKT